MEPVLRSPHISGLEPLGPVRFFPIRHHSPACSYHLRRIIEAWRPDCLLIEGPENAGALIPVLCHAGTQAPVAFYYYYKDSRGLLGEEKGEYKCYYPFLNASPELVALREASARGIAARFIDLPYGEILLGTAKERGMRREGEKQTYNDDYLLSRSRYLARLCEKTGLRDFGEFWEKYFEIGGLFLSSEEFVGQMLVYCALSREATPAEELEADGCLLRERYMAKKLAEASGQYERILAVTGGFHTAGLAELLKEAEEVDDALPEGRPEAAAGKKRPARLVYTGPPVSLHGLTKEEQGVYALAYSMEAADSLNGYASGMPSPGFYEQVWKRLSQGKGAADDGSATACEGATAYGNAAAYEGAVLHQLVSAGRLARRRGEAISSYDVACAFAQAKGLAALRGKQAPGLYELRDSALSSFVKGECNLSADLPLRLLQELNTGRQAGRLSADAERPPILRDFEEQCRRFGLKIHTAARQEVTLELFAKKKHMAQSRFLHQLDFLKIGFAKRTKGADLLNRRDRSRVREIWSCHFSGQVPAALTDCSASGGTVAEAAAEQLRRQYAGSTGTKEAARLLTQGFLMGFTGQSSERQAHLEAVLAADGDFFSLAEGFSYLRMLYELQQLYDVRDEARMTKLLSLCFQKLTQLLPSMAGVSKEQETACMSCCLALYQSTGHEALKAFRPRLSESFERLLAQPECRPGLNGAVLGLLYGEDGAWEERIVRTAAGYLQGSPSMCKKSAAFLRGLFYTARDIVFVQKRFVSMIDSLIAGLDAETFLELLPGLRMAFGYFTPMETDRIAGQAAALHKAEKKHLSGGLLVSPLAYEYGENLDGYGIKRMEEVWDE